MPHSSLKWEYKLKIKDLLSDSEDEENARRVGLEIRARIEKFVSTLPQDDWLRVDLEEIAENFEIDQQDINALDQVNYRLEELYDIGDRYRIWIG